jgi:hypothetical protein
MAVFKTTLLIVLCAIINFGSGHLLFYCNQTELINAFLDSCYEDNFKSLNCSVGYDTCLEILVLQTQETIGCVRQSLASQTQSCSIQRCTQDCCDKSCKLIPGLQGAGLPDGYETIDPYLIIKILILTSLLFTIGLTVLIAVKCFGKHSYDHEKLLIHNIIHVVHEHQVGLPLY